jgi:glycosyltransferase involved in cell wall biosynthesis
MSERNRPRPILVIAGYPPSLVNFRGPLLQAMRDECWPVEAAAPRLRQDGPTIARLAQMGIAAHDIPLARSSMNPFADLRLLFSLVRLMRRRRPGIVLAYTPKACMFGLIAGFIARVPRRYALITGIGYAFIGNDARRRLALRMSTLLYRSSLKRADKLFFQNPDDVALFRQLGLFPASVPALVVNGSGVDLAHFRLAPLPAGPIRFVLAARLLSTKGIREYAAAAAVVRRRHADVEFDLVGGFDDNPDSITPAEVDAWQRAGTLAWHGEVADIRPIIAKAHVFVLPSYREGTPRSVLEAMAMGRPVITTDAPGCRETAVDGVNGFLVPPRSVDDLAQAMARFVEAPELVRQMGGQSRAIAELKYDVHEVNRQMLHEMGLD